MHPDKDRLPSCKKAEGRRIKSQIVLCSSRSVGDAGKEDGLQVGRHRVARLMRENGLRAMKKCRYKNTTDSSYGSPVAANLRDQDFGCEGPDQKWGADISYIWTAEGALSGHRS